MELLSLGTLYLQVPPCTLPTNATRTLPGFARDNFAMVLFAFPIAPSGLTWVHQQTHVKDELGGVSRCGCVMRRKGSEEVKKQAGKEPLRRVHGELPARLPLVPGGGCPPPMLRTRIGSSVVVGRHIVRRGQQQPSSHIVPQGPPNACMISANFHHHMTIASDWPLFNYCRVEGARTCGPSPVPV